MNWAANHAGFVLAAYLITALMLLGLIVWVLLRDRRLRKRVTEQEQRKS